MRFHVLIAISVLSASASLLSQIDPTATEGESPYSVGGGVSTALADIDHGRLFGGTVWGDYKFNKPQNFLHGVGFEVEAKEMLSGHFSSGSSSVKQTTVGGGVTYTFYHFRNFRPYGKAIWEYGNADYPTSSSSSYSQSRTVTSLGGGLEYHAFGKVWVRADYEYQIWPDFFKHSDGAAGRLNPQGFTVGLTYHFGRKSPMP